MLKNLVSTRCFLNKEIRALVVALGTAIAESFNMENLRYDKIIIMTDADVDGAHIRTLLLTLFYRYFQPLMVRAYLYCSSRRFIRSKKEKNPNMLTAIRKKIK